MSKVRFPLSAGDGLAKFTFHTILSSLFSLISLQESADHPFLYKKLNNR